MEFLRSINEEGKVIAIVGPSRSGKSTKLCNLIGRAGAFRIGNQTDGVTKGIWIWKGNTYHQFAAGEPPTRIIFLDTEGLGDIENDESWDLKLLTLSVLLSSEIIFNLKERISREVLDQLVIVGQVVRDI